MRTATVADIVTRLTGIDALRYAMTSEKALGWGMGDAQLDISTALDTAINAGQVEVVRVQRDTRFVRATNATIDARRVRENSAEGYLFHIWIGGRLHDSAVTHADAFDECRAQRKAGVREHMAITRTNV